MIARFFWPRRSKSAANGSAAALMECHFSMTAAIETLEKVSAGELAFERTVRTRRMLNNQIKNKSASGCDAQLSDDQPVAESERLRFQPDHQSGDEACRTEEEVQGGCGKPARRKTATLLEELSLRTKLLQSIMKRVYQVGCRMDELETQIRDLRRSRRNVDELHRYEREMHDLMLMTQETPEKACGPGSAHPGAVCRLDAGQAGVVGR